MTDMMNGKEFYAEKKKYYITIHGGQFAGISNVLVPMYYKIFFS